ncbi:TraB/GumN family protein [Chitinibacter sp. FCG-7]|uniref:TraB/GumN family protein n=1 Tax=Chitinibacter mangrovi TaxID=3153927 RepID=A0AAU7F9S1_9NEIS
MFSRLRPLIVLILSAQLLLTGCSANAEKTNPSNAVLWKIEMANSPASWLLATVNTPDGQDVEFKPEVEPALLNSKYIGTEYYNDMNSSIQLAQAMLTKDASLQALLGQERYAKVLPLLAARGYPENVAAKLQPWAVAMLLFSPKQGKENIPMDEYVFQYATETNKPYFAIESIEQQLAPFKKLPAGKQIILIDGLIANHDALESAFASNMAAYQKSNLDPIAPLMQIETIALPKHEQAWFNVWRKELKTSRNKIIIERLKPALQKGEAFFTVAAGQLTGQDGLLAAMRAAGYKVTAVKVEPAQK